MCVLILLISYINNIKVSWLPIVAVTALLTIGHIEGWDSTWALRRSAELGYHFETGGATDVVELFKAVLDKDDVNVGSTKYSNTFLWFTVYGLLKLMSVA